ncbi:MAG: hypothetical protein H7Y17_07735 [Chlorobia bacterium]|nr:hypothetical protein [Fimbriimonadaceae bacterium]
MNALIAITALITQSPPDLKLEIEKAIVVNDDEVSQLPRPHTRNLTGCMVADDGSTAFDANKGIIKLGYTFGYRPDNPLFLREWEPESAPVTDPQRGWMSLQSGKIDTKKHLFKEVVVGSVIRAENEKEVTVVHDTDKLAAISQVSLAYDQPSYNRWLFRPREGVYAGQAIADLSSDALVGWMAKKDGDSYNLIEHRLLNSKETGKIESVPGISPFRYDSSIDGLLCFTFSESGFPASLMFQHFNSKNRETLPRPSGSMSVTALLPKGRVIVTITNRRGDEGEDPKLGLYEMAPPYKEAKFVGPYRLVGSSRNGKWLLIQHRNLRKSWMVLTK